MIEREPGRKSLCDSPNVALMLVLTSREVKAMLAAFKFPVRVLVPLGKECLSKRLQLKTDLAPRRCRGLPLLSSVVITAYLHDATCDRLVVIVATQLHDTADFRLVIIVIQLHHSTDCVIVVTILLHDAALCIVIIAVNLHHSTLRVTISPAAELHDTAHASIIVVIIPSKLHHTAHAACRVVISDLHLAFQFVIALIN